MGRRQRWSRHRVDDDGRFLTLELVDRSHPCPRQASSQFPDLVVERGDDQDVGRAQLSLGSVHIDIPLPDQGLPGLLDLLGLLRRAGRIAHPEVTAFVSDLAYEVEEDPAVLRNGVVPVEQVLQRRGPCAGRMQSLRRLGQLLRVAEEHHGLGGACHCHGVGEGELAGFVDHQDVDGARHVGMRPQPGGSAHERGIARLQGRNDCGVCGGPIHAGHPTEVVDVVAALDGRSADLAQQVADDGMRGGR